MHHWWRCTRCDVLIDSPHEGPFGECLCESCCTVCSSGATRAWLEQQIKEGNYHTSLDDAIVGHGAPTRGQMAAAEAWSP